MTTSLGLIRTVIVDNDETELQELVTGMHEAHIPVVPLRYSVDAGVIGVPDHKSLCIRLLFVDMNLADSSAPSPKDIAPTIAEVISAVVPLDNGPYALIFWSKHRHLVDEVLQILGERHAEIPMPIVVSALDKNDFKMPESADARKAWLEGLRKGIDSVVQTSPQLTALMAWEREIGRAASATLHALTKVLSPSIPWDIAKHADNLSAVLGRIAQEATGRKNAADRPDEAIHLGLQPMLVDNLERSSATADGIREMWTAAMPQVKSNSPIAFGENGADRRLNAFYCVSEITTQIEKTDRGAFVAISDDHLNDDCFKSHFGKTVAELSEEFVDVSGLTRTQKSEIRKSVKWGFIEISADCDHAQRKSRLYRYVLAALVPSDREDNTKFKGMDGSITDRRHNAIYRMPEIELADGKPLVLFANFRYLLGLPAKASILGDVVLRIRSGILAELIHNYSRYVARPGVVSFSHES
ncbi:hypothetical protein F3J20_27230 [Paraburkholderia sp. Cy-641]|uniref:hypothetical protein n=1 Tax=Paraburkholderia sp. Cy-641 TaxID=2608337 RepID=UPI00141E989C|nr:hypothetical protein [Paraburkholderia sp. Cy-641]NIF81029.1 hypothetical protein [Paraburkholderia sp. Cy-641]